MYFKWFTFVNMALLVLLSGCGGDDVRDSVQSHSGFRTPCAPKFAKKAYNRPYQIKGNTYTPHSHYEINEIGIASYYGGTDVFHGRKTSNGEIFDMNRLSAAHKHLLIPCVVRVTNLENGRSIKVKINDRGPFIEGRVIDVSRKVAQLLGFYHKGTARVHVETVMPDTLQLVQGEIDDETLQMAEVDHNYTPFIPAPGPLQHAPLIPSVPVERPTSPSVSPGPVPKHMHLSPQGEILLAGYDSKIPYDQFSDKNEDLLDDSLPIAPQPRPAVQKGPKPAPLKKPILKTNSSSKLPKLMKGSRGYFVQATTSREEMAAKKTLHQLRQIFPAAMVRLETMTFGQTSIHRILVGPFKSKPEAGSLLKKVSSAGHQNAVVVYNG